MKWVFGVLVLANVALFMWGMWYRAPLVGDIPRPRPPVAAEKMKLSSEPGVELRLHPPRPAIPPPDQLATAPRCYRLGPFTAPGQAQAAARTLEAWGLEHTQVAEPETLAPIYRVYLSPLASRAQAERKRRELTRLGFTDHALIQQEQDMENGISLGLFSVEQNARARAAQLARRGVKASIQPLPNVQLVYWLVLSTPAIDSRIGGTVLTRFSEVDWGAEVALRPLPCNVEADSLPDVTRPAARR